MKSMLNFLLIFSLIYGTAPHTHAAVQSQQLQYRAFKKSDVISLNKHKDTHALAQAALIHTQSAPLREEIKKLLQDKAQPLSPFRLRGKTIEFKFNKNTYLIQHVRDSQFSFNGQMVDLQRKDWYKKVLNTESSASNLWRNLLLPKAHAGIPAIVGIIVIISVVGCIGAAALDKLNKTMEKASENLSPNKIFEDPEKFNQSMMTAEQEVCGTLSCCVNSSTTTHKINHSAFFKDACKLNPKNFDKEKEALFKKHGFDENNKYFISNLIDDNPDYMPACRARSLNQSVIDYGDRINKKSKPPTFR